MAQGVHNWLAIAVDVLKLPNLKALTGRWSTFAVVHHQHGLEVVSYQERMGLSKCIAVLYSIRGVSCTIPFPGVL